MAKKFHPITLPGCHLGPEEIGRALARLRFDVLLEVLKAFLFELRTQAFKDQERNRPQLAQALLDAMDRMSPVVRCIDRAWRMSRPHMEHELARDDKNRPL